MERDMCGGKSILGFFVDWDSIKVALVVIFGQVHWKLHEVPRDWGNWFVILGLIKDRKNKSD